MKGQKGGHIVTFKDKDGKVQKATCIYEDQKPEFGKRLFLRMVNDDMSPKIDPGNGKKLISVKFPEEVTVIGFID